MKRYLIALTLALVTGAVSAAEMSEKDAALLADAQLKMIEHCASWATKAELEMTAYQLGMTLDQAIEHQRQFYAKQPDLLAKANDLLMDIHSQRRFDDETFQKKAIAKYRTHVHQLCLIKVRGVLNQLRAKYGH